MGLLVGRRKLRRTIASMLTQCAQRADAGEQRFTVMFSQLDVGTGNDLASSAIMVEQAIRSAGYDVVEVNNQAWAYTVHMIVEAPNGGPRSSRHVSGDPAGGVAETLASFGRYDLLGADDSGIDDRAALELTRPLRERRYRGDEEAVRQDIRSAAAQGGWSAIGAWRFLSGYTSGAEQTDADILDAFLNAVHANQNQYSEGYLRSQAETARYREKFGG